MDSELQELIDAVSRSDDKRAAAASKKLMSVAGTANSAQRSQAVRKLAPLLHDLADPGRLSTLSLVCGGMVEIGADPLPLEAPLLEKFVPSLRALANEVANQEAPVAAVQKVPDTPTLAIAPAKSPGLLRTLWNLFTATRRLNKAMKEAQRLEELRPKSDAEQMVNALYPSVMAMFGASPQLRAAHPEVAELAAAVDSHCLSALFSTLANEPFLILEPSTRRGMLATVSGVDINFSLNMLILHTFPDGEGKQKSRLTKRAATVLVRGSAAMCERNGVWSLESL